MKRILSIDGGGIRGIIPARILTELETRTGRRTHELFDLIAGTSTGGIIALGLTLPDAQGLPVMTAADLGQLYSQRGAEIFQRSLWRGVTTAGALIEEKYDSAPLETILLETFGKAKLRSALTPVLVTGYEIQDRATVFMKSWHKSFKNLEMRFAARATSAAPTYFEPANIKLNGQSQAVIDGGVFVNNPALSAYAEARRLWPEEDLYVLSLGTGKHLRSISYSEAKGWGLAQWALPLLSCIFDGSSKAVDYQLRQLLPHDYHRLQIELTIASDDMDNTTKGNIHNLHIEADRLLESQSAPMEAIIARLSD